MIDRDRDEITVVAKVVPVVAGFTAQPGDQVLIITGVGCIGVQKQPPEIGENSTPPHAGNGAELTNQTIVDWVRVNGPATTREICNGLGITEPRARQGLTDRVRKQMVNAGLIHAVKEDNAKRYRHYAVGRM
jgi:hypothetical protein